MKRYKDIAGDGGSDIVGQVREQAERVRARLALVRYVIAVMSGKGGVGKSTVTVNLGAALARQGREVAILDADINGPSIARMTGVRGQTPLMGSNGLRPARAAGNIGIMSIDLFLREDADPVLWDAPTQKDSFTWRGMMEAAALREMISDTDWGTLDYLLVDLPPGAEKLPTLSDLVGDLSGSIIVTLPSGLSHYVVAKSVTLARKLVDAPLLGVIENMSAYICPSCGNTEPFFEAEKEDRWEEEMGLRRLGSIPFDPQLVRCADSGQPYIEAFPGAPAARVFEGIAADLEKQLRQG